MPQVRFRELRSAPNRFAGFTNAVRVLLLLAFLAQATLVCLQLHRGWPCSRDARWPEGLALVLAAAAAIAALTRELPAQNVMLASAVIAFLGGAIAMLGASSGVPFGPFTYTDSIGRELFPSLPWTLPLIWLVAVLASRGAARFLLRPWRQAPAYGFWLIGITALLVVVFALSLEPLASIRHYWLWNMTRTTLTWYCAPWVNFIGWGVSATLILAFATPALLIKKPGQPPTDYLSPIIWLVALAVFAIGAASRQLWPAVMLDAGAALLVVVIVLSGQALLTPAPQAEGREPRVE